MGKSTNDFKFVYNADIALTKLDFKAKKHSIGDEKNWGDISVKTNNNTLTITIKADRHGDEKPAKFYKNFVGENTQHMIHTARGSNSPSKLNFAVEGTLYINQDEFEVCLGQGHYSSTNNWHLCSKSIEAKSDNKGGEIINENTKLEDQLYLDPSGSNSFKIKCVSQLSGSQDNEFILTIPDSKFETFEFNTSSAIVTIGQPYKEVTSSIKNGKGIITVKAGRHKSQTPAKWFNNNIGKGSTIASFTTDKKPSELNFAIKGNLRFSIDGKKYQISNVVIGQGSNIGLQNNWWLGGKEMKGINLPLLGGGILAVGIGISTAPFLFKSILNPNEMSINKVDIKKSGANLEELLPMILEEINQ
ncbi:hypothetical protein F7018_09415 [Tenacibaculum aiptasiae]|uniref:Uncharacterized protein n=1 Tax=Tenacibaculum aiptasiae TaxID=426481 RepID=A0A7J5ALG2_9FLAO|nr:hypothetical protein [Tenacibaculum aiptasiae]KAB1158385.1 hypothetical protein F7018_09415 [Tenacibaculum aiptasiae]